MNSLSKHTGLLKRFSTFELSYETVSHKKVLSNESIAVCVPVGRKYFMWFTYREGSCEDVCYVFGLDKDKQICSVEEVECVAKGLCLGTTVYCTLVEVPSTGQSYYVAEDIYQFRGIPLHNLCFGDRIGFLRDFVRIYARVALPIMWLSSSLDHNIPADLEKRMSYTPHHIQYREVRRVAPYINVAIPKKGGIGSGITVATSSADVARKLYATEISKPLPLFDYAKPAYRYPAVFSVMADAQLDLYHLYAYGGVESKVWCGLAGIQSFRTSVFMNRIFRRIRENENLDLAEESEDEADFENTDTNKFVDLDKVAQIECVFSARHKKWIPVRLSNDKLVHIEKLVKSQDYRGNPKFERNRKFR